MEEEVKGQDSSLQLVCPRTPAHRPQIAPDPRAGATTVTHALPADMRGALITLVSRRVAAFEARPPSRFGAVAWCPTSHRSCASSSQGPQTGPDASRGYDVSEYAGLWRTLSELEPRWPSSQSVAVVGPIGDGFAASALACRQQAGELAASRVIGSHGRDGHLALQHHFILFGIFSE